MKTTWKLVESSQNYHYWSRVLDGDTIYNCTSTKLDGLVPPFDTDGGYKNLDALKSLKGDLGYAGESGKQRSNGDRPIHL